MSFPVVDLHCDLLSYLQEAPNANPENLEDIGCSFPALAQGNVKLQVMAIYTATQKGSSNLGLQQSIIFNNLLNQHAQKISKLKSKNDLKNLTTSSKINVVAAIENAAGFCEEDESYQ